MGVYVIYGNEQLFLRNQRIAFKTQSANPEFEYGEFTEPGAAISFLTTYNLFSDELYAYLKVDTLKEVTTKSFLEFMKSISQQKKHLLVEVAKVKTKTDLKNLNKFEGIACVKEYSKTKDKRLLKQYFDNICKAHGTSFTEEAREQMLQRLDYEHNDAVDLVTVDNYVGQLKYLSSEIDETDVKNNVPDLREGKRFALACLIADGKAAQVFEEADKLKREKDYSAIGLLSLLHREYRISYLKKIGISTYEQKVYGGGNLAASMSEQRLLAGLNTISDFIRDIKLGVYDEVSAFDICLTQLLSA